MTNYTPRPWEAFREDNGEWSIESTYGTIATVVGENCGPQEQVVADAMLLAAAPDLMEVLQELVEFADNDTAVQPGALIWQEARTVISKAKGAPWYDDSIQFPRLIAELQACVAIDASRMEAIADSMGVDVRRVEELFDRAVAEWDRIKAEMP